MTLNDPAKALLSRVAYRWNDEPVAASGSSAWSSIPIKLMDWSQVVYEEIDGKYWPFTPVLTRMFYLLMFRTWNFDLCHNTRFIGVAAKRAASPRVPKSSPKLSFTTWGDKFPLRGFSEILKEACHFRDFSLVGTYYLKSNGKDCKGSNAQGGIGWEWWWVMMSDDEWWWVMWLGVVVNYLQLSQQHVSP